MWVHSCDMVVVVTLSTVIFSTFFCGYFFIFSLGTESLCRALTGLKLTDCCLCFCLCLQGFWDLRQAWPFSLPLIAGLWEAKDKQHMVAGLAAGQIFC